MSVFAHGVAVAEDVALATGVQPSNLACAVAVALVLGVEPSVIGARLTDLPSVDHRLQAVRSPSGVTILDDTYNSNPAGAAEALAVLAGVRDLGPRRRPRTRIRFAPAGGGHPRDGRARLAAVRARTAASAPPSPRGPTNS